MTAVDARWFHCQLMLFFLVILFAMEVSGSSGSSFPFRRSSAYNTTELFRKRGCFQGIHRRLLGPALRPPSEFENPLEMKIEQIKRGSESLGCTTTSTYRDLGRQYFPRYIRTVECSSDCFQGHFSCVPRNYIVKVLRRRVLTGDNCDIEPDNLLPESLRKEWVLENITVTVCCECSQ